MSHRRTKPTGVQRTYGLLVGKIKDGRMDPGGRSPHYQIWVQADSDYRIAVNVLSVDGSNVIALFDPDFKPPTKLDLTTLALGSLGFTPLGTGPDGQGLDYLRDNLFPIQRMAPIPPEGAGVTLANLSMRTLSARKRIARRSSWHAVSFFVIKEPIKASISRPSKVCTIST